MHGGEGEHKPETRTPASWFWQVCRGAEKHAKKVGGGGGGCNNGVALGSLSSTYEGGRTKTPLMGTSGGPGNTAGCNLKWNGGWKNTPLGSERLGVCQGKYWTIARGVPETTRGKTEWGGSTHQKKKKTTARGAFLNETEWQVKKQAKRIATTGSTGNEPTKFAKVGARKSKQKGN